MQRRLSNGSWIDLDEEAAQRFVSLAATHNNVSEKEIADQLATGKEVRYHPEDWYPYIRQGPPPKKIRPRPTLVVCDCGHTIPQNAVMATSHGTSCARCYDKMSN